MKDADGAIIEETEGVAPAKFEIAFTGNVDKNTVADGISIAAGDDTIDYDYAVDYENSLIVIEPTEEYVGGTEYTITVDGLANFGGAPQKNIMSKAFTTAGEAPVEPGYTINYNDNQIVVDVNVGEWNAEDSYRIYLALYQGNELKAVYASDEKTTAESDLTVNLETAINIDDYQVKAFVWEGMRPIF